MASVTLTGTLLDPTGEVAVGDQIRFTHVTTTGKTVKNARSIIIIPPTGLYNFTLEFGLIFVEYLDVKDVNYKNLGVVTVNGDTTATDLPGLLNAIVPPTDEQLLLFQGILADTEDARDIAVAAAAQQTTLELIFSVVIHPAGTVLTLSGYTLSGDGGGAQWKLNGVTGQTVSQSPSLLADGLLNDASGNQWALVPTCIVNFKKFGAIGDGITDDTLPIFACRNFVESNGGKIIDDGFDYLITEVITWGKGAVEFEGQGHDLNLFALSTKGTRFIWGGGVSPGVMMAIRTVDSVASKKVGGVKLSGFVLIGSGDIKKGLNLRTVDNCEISNIGVEQCTEWGILTDTNINIPAGGTATEALDNQHNDLRNIVINMTGMLNAGGLKLTANPLSPPSNTSMNEIHNLSVRIEDGTALHFGNSDSNTVQHFRVFREIAFSGLAVEYDEQLADPAPNTNFMYARTNVIYHMHSSQAGILVHDTVGAFRPAVDNAIYGFNLDGNAPNLTVTRNSIKSLKIFSARNSELPTIGGIGVTSDGFELGNALSVTAINVRDALGLSPQPASFLYKENASGLHQVIADDNGNVFSITINEGTGNFVIKNISGGGLIELGDQLQLQGQTTAATASAGGGAALPATPQGYLEIIINGVLRKIPFYPV